jgi:opacity protein-like surface antigen
MLRRRHSRRQTVKLEQPQIYSAPGALYRRVRPSSDKYLFWGEYLMRLFITTAAAALAIAGAASAQTAPTAKPVPQATSGQYIAVSGGFIGKTDYDYRFANGYRFDGDVDAGGQGALAWGTAFGDGWRAEVALGYRSQKSSGVLSTGGGAQFDFDGGKVTAFSIDLNGYYDFSVAGPVRPYLGAGIGVAQVKTDDGMLDDKGDALTLQGIAGASFAVSPRVSLFAEGRYQYTGAIKVKTTSWAGDKEQKLNMTGPGALVGARFAF